MEKIRFNKPISSIYGTDFRDTPKSLKNCYVDIFSGSVKRVELDTDDSLGFQQKPYMLWNDRIISNHLGFISFDEFNNKLYAIHSTNGLSVLESDYTSGSGSSVLPTLASVAHSTLSAPGAWTSVSIKGVISYLIVPFNDRDEAGPSTYHGIEFDYYKYADSFIQDEQDYTVVRKPDITLTLTASTGIAYYQVYRTVEHLSDTGFSNDMNYYSLGRFEGAGIVTITDTKVWQYETLYSELAELLSDKIASPSVMVEIGVIMSSEGTISDLVYDRPLNIHTQDYTASPFNGNNTTFALNAVDKFYAEAMLNRQNMMLYGNVTWALKQPKVACFVSGSDDVRFQYEYKVSGQTYYGPVLECTNVARVSVPWQGEFALHVWEKVGVNWLYKERLVPDFLGRYVTNGTKSRTFGQATTFSKEVTSFWSYDTDTPVASGPIDATEAVTNSVNESNVIFMSVIFRPFEVTFDQIFLPAEETIIDMLSARLGEEENRLDYNGYIFTNRNVYWLGIDVKERAANYDTVNGNTGVKTTKSGKAAATNLEIGVAYIGTDNRVRVVVGRESQRIDEVCDDLWTAAYDIAYKSSTKDLYVLTDTGIWVYNIDKFKGFFKHIHIPGLDTTAALLDSEIGYLNGVVNGVGSYDNIIVYSDGANEYVLENSSTYSKDTEIETHRIISPNHNTIKLDNIVLDFDERTKVVKVDGTATTNTLTIDTGTEDIDRFAVTNEDDYILIVGAGTAGAAHYSRITTYTSPTQASILDNIVTTIDDEYAIFPVALLEVTSRNRDSLIKEYKTWKDKKLYPKYYARDFVLKAKNFKEFHEINFDVSEL